MQILDIIERVKFYFLNIRKKWLTLLITALILGTLMALHSLCKPTFYTAATIFHPEAERNVSNPTEGLSVLFGGMQAEDSEMTYMQGLLKSRSLTQALVGDSILFEGKPYLLADLILANNPKFVSLPGYLINLVDPKGNWENATVETKVYFAGKVLKSCMKMGKTPEGFAELSVGFYDPKISGLLCEQYLLQLKRYYGQQKSQRTQQTIQFLGKRADSIKQELDTVNYALARNIDQGRFRLFAKDDIYPAELESKQSILSQMYVSLYISQENTRAQQQLEIPVIQVIDPPLPPFPVTRSSVIVYAILGLMLGAFMGCILVSWPLLKEDISFAFQEFVIKPIYAQAEQQRSAQAATDTSEEEV